MNSKNMDIVALVSQIEDPRSRDCPHNFFEIVVTTICAAVCGMVEWDEIYFFACENKEWLQKKLKVEFTNGIPSKFTFARVISLIEPNSFSKIFTSWIQAIYPQKKIKLLQLTVKL